MTDLTKQSDNSPEALFRAKITERIREDIGNLMPDEMLQSVIADAINSELYRDARPSTQSWGMPQPWIREVVKKQIADKLQTFLTTEIDNREDEIRQIFEEQLRADFPRLFGQLLLEMVKANNYNLQAAMASSGAYQ